MVSEKTSVAMHEQFRCCGGRPMALQRQASYTLEAC
jgi:hypothetical protein